jgi:hypothetical protein
MQVSGFTIVKNATKLDFPLEASLLSVLPAVDELVVNVGRSEDDTLDRVHRLDEPRIRVIETDWDHSRGPAMLADETAVAMSQCRFSWGIYIQADEVFADGAAALLRSDIERIDPVEGVEGMLVNYRHFYGGLDRVAINRRWYRRECRAVRLGSNSGVRSFRDAQGFRIGAENRRIRCVLTDAVIHHYGWARPAWALAAKRTADNQIYPWRSKMDQERPLLPWFPGIREFIGEHPMVAREWVDARRSAEGMIEEPSLSGEQVRLWLSNQVERFTGWRPFEYRNYRRVRG